MEKRGQAALEFLMTYGWAILVVLVAIGALAYFGVLRPERLLPEKCIVATGSGLYCDDYSANTTGLNLRLKNIQADALTITNVAVTATGETCVANTTSTTIQPESTADIAIPCSTFTSGDKVKGEVSISYSKVGGLSKSASGQVVTTVA